MGIPGSVLYVRIGICDWQAPESKVEVVSESWAEYMHLRKDSREWEPWRITLCIYYITLPYSLR